MGWNVVLEHKHILHPGNDAPCHHVTHCTFKSYEEGDFAARLWVDAPLNSCVIWHLLIRITRRQTTRV